MGNNNGNSEKPLLRVSEVCDLLGVSAYTVKEMARRNIFEGQQIRENGWWYVTRRSVEDYAEARNLDLNWDRVQGVDKNRKVR